MSTTAAATFGWREEFTVHDPRMDEQHKKLIALVGDLHRAMVLGKGNQVLAAVLNELLKYVGEHFADEEGLMRKLRYPKILEHIAEHRKFAENARKLHSEFAHGQVALSMELMAFLSRWLRTHICGMDRGYAEHIQKIQAPAAVSRPA